MHQLYRHTHTISTPFSPRPASGLHRYTRQSSHRKPIHQRHRPTDTRAQPATQTNPPTTLPHRYHTPQIPQPYSLHKHHTTIHTHHNRTAPQTHATQARPTDADVVDAPTLSQHRRRRSSAIGQARRRIRPHKTGQDQARPLTTHSTRPASGLRKFSAKPDHKLIRDAIRRRRCRRCRYPLVGRQVGCWCESGTGHMPQALIVPACWEVF